MLTVPINDYGFALAFTCTKSDNLSVFDLTGYTIHFVVWSPGVPTTKLVDGICTSPAPTTGVCYYIVALADFKATGTFSAEIQISKAGTARETFIKFPLQVVEAA